MKTKLFLFLALLAIAANSFARKIGDLYYTLNSTTLTAEVTSEHSSSPMWTTKITTADIPSTITYNNKTYRVTSIGEFAFYGCDSLISVEIPSSITNINRYAFCNCTRLTSVTIPNSVTSIGESAFSECSGLTYANINAQTIGMSAFKGCGLTSVVLGGSVTKITSYAFHGCSRLYNVYVPNSVTTIGNQAFLNVGNVVYSGTATGIPWGANCANGYVDGWLVYNDTSKTQVISCSREAIGSIILSNSVTSIMKYAFSDCTGLTSVTIPNRVTSIGSSAFYGCTSLTSVTIPNGITNIGYRVFSGCSSLTSFNIPNSVTIIGQDAFSYCSGLTSVIIGDSVTSIGDYAFRGCSGLITIDIPNSVTSLEKWAFAKCTRLTSVTIPSSVTSIGYEAFRECDSLTSVYLLGENPPTLEGEAFFGSWPQSIYVPCGSLNNYKTTSGWAYYSSTIKYQSLPYNVQLNFNDEQGKIESSINNTICDTIFTMTASPSYGYHFTTWDDEVTETTRIVHLTQDTTFTAEFAKNTYIISYDAESAYGHVAGIASAEYLDTITFETSANYGYHFVKWSDGNTDNPRTIVLTQDTSFVAEFVPNKYSMSVTCDEQKGGVSGENGQFDYLSDLEYTATPLYGYHFTNWSDGVTDNPRTIILTQDSSITAIFSPNMYTFSATCDEILGLVESVNGDYPYLTELAISANPLYGYHFTQWSDGNTENPRTITIERDSALTALFAPNTYQLALTCNMNEGRTQGAGAFDYLSEITITAIPNYGYHFTQWSDGNTDNPRAIILTQDTTLEALFAKNIYEANIQANYVEMGTVTGDGSYEYLSQVTISATPNYGYHFVKWLGIKDYIPQDAITASQAYSIAAALSSGAKTSTQYTIVGYVTGKYGSYTNSYYLSDSPNVSGNFIAFKCNSSANIGDRVIVTGYLTNYKGTTPETTSGATLTKVVDVSSSNPCTFTLTQDTTITAVFAKNTFTLTAQTANSLMGSVTGSGIYEYLTNISMMATPAYGYHFVQWNDGNTENPRDVVITRDSTFIATFAKNPVITYICDQTMGQIVGDTTLASEPTGNVTFEAVPNYGYHFVRWADGSNDNPRTIYLANDVTYEALFAVDRSGTCGVDNQLQWQYSPTDKTLIISGTGSLSENYTFGAEAPTQMTNLYIGNDVTDIGSYAFYQMTTINHLVIGGGVTSIGNYAFAECKNFDDITCYATTVPTITSKTFYNIGNKQYIYLFVPEGRERAYHRDTYWGEFDIQVQNAETVTETTTDVDIVPTDNTATITWPSVDGAETYEIEITKDGEVVCTLIFNANGQLTGIAFAPSRNNTQQGQTTGFRFTITGLTSSTQYGYTVAAKDANDQTVDTKSGSFTTTGETPTALDQIDSSSLQGGDRGRLIYHNGQIFILRGEKVYTLTGQEVR